MPYDSESKQLNPNMVLFFKVKVSYSEKEPSQWLKQSIVTSKRKSTKNVTGQTFTFKGAQIGTKEDACLKIMVVT